MYIRCFCFLFLCLFFSACSDPVQKTDSSSAGAEQPRLPIKKTLGVLELDGLLLDSVTGYEVFVVSKLEPEAVARIARQRELLAVRLGGGELNKPVGHDLGVAPDDYIRLTELLQALNESFPPLLKVDLDLGNNRLRKLISDADKYEEYAYLFGSIQFDNMERALNFINEKYEMDAKALVKKAEQLKGEDFEREKVTLDWLNLVAKHLGRYVELATEYSKAQVVFTSGQGSIEPQDWAAYSAYYRQAMITGVSLHSLGSVLLAAAGPFEVEGHGTLVVRVEYGANSAYFIVSEDESLVSVKDLRQIVVD